MASAGDSPRSKLRESLSLRGMRSNFVHPPRETSPNLNRFTVRPKSEVKDFDFPSVNLLLDNDGSANATYLCSKYALPVKSKGLLKWLQAQDSYLLPAHGVSFEDRALLRKDRVLLKTYSLFGDTLVNNFLRGTLGELQDRMIHNESFLKLLGLMLYDLFDSYKPLMILPPTREQLMYKSTSQIDERVIMMIVDRNKEFIKNPTNLAPLISHYSEELKRIINNAPKLTSSLTVYRGFKSEDHLTSLSFTSIDFTSTSLSIKAAIKFALFNETTMKDSANREKLFGGVYEITLPPGTPCVYLESVTNCSGEFEILLPPGINFNTDSKIYYKQLNADRVAVIHVAATLVAGGSRFFRTTRKTKSKRTKSKKNSRK